MKQVFLVEDHHSDPDAQKLLAEKLVNLCAIPGTMLAVEGHFSESMPLIGTTTAAALLQQGEISGGQYAIHQLISQGTPIVQLDNEDLYQQNLDSLKKFFTIIEKNSPVINDLRIVATGIDPAGFTGALERAALAFHFQSQRTPTSFHSETWLLLVYSLLNLAIGWKEWQTVERVFTRDLWRDTFAEHLSTHLEIDLLFECIDASIVFYSLNAKRDPVYAENIDKVLNGGNRLVFALGPFHHHNLSVLLRKKSIDVHRIEVPNNPLEHNVNSYRRQIMDM